MGAIPLPLSPAAVLANSMSAAVAALQPVRPDAFCETSNARRSLVSCSHITGASQPVPPTTQAPSSPHSAVSQSLHASWTAGLPQPLDLRRVRRARQRQAVAAGWRRRVLRQALQGALPLDVVHEDQAPHAGSADLRAPRRGDLVLAVPGCVVLGLLVPGNRPNVLLQGGREAPVRVPERPVAVGPRQVLRVLRYQKARI
jgi:hypothetical protein